MNKRIFCAIVKLGEGDTMAIATIKEPSPSVKWALAELERVLGKGLSPSAMPVIEGILSQLEQEAYESGFEQAQYTVGDWNKP
jgi:hypothetical protein